MTYLLALEPLLFYPGDHMSRDEFLARWEITPHRKCEDYGVVSALNQGLCKS